MLLIKCPTCGTEGDETDFHYGGEGHVQRPSSQNPTSVSDDAHRDYLYVRKNPRGIHAERWLCERGCGKWFHALRDTATLAISGTYLISELAPGNPAKAKPVKAPKKAKTAAAKRASAASKKAATKTKPKTSSQKAPKRKTKSGGTK